MMHTWSDFVSRYEDMVGYFYPHGIVATKQYLDPFRWQILYKFRCCDSEVRIMLDRTFVRCDIAGNSSNDGVKGILYNSYAWISQDFGRGFVSKYF